MSSHLDAQRHSRMAHPMIAKGVKSWIPRRMNLISVCTATMKGAINNHEFLNSKKNTSCRQVSFIFGSEHKYM